MSCKSAIYTVNSTNADVATTAGTFVQVPLGSVIRRYGSSLRLDGGSILAIGGGYFKVDASLSFTPTGAGPVSVQVRQDGMEVPGLTATAQATAGNPVAIPLAGLIRNCGRDCTSALTLWVDAPGNVTNLAIVVEKQ